MINIAKIGRDLMIKEPFYGLFLLGLQKELSTKIDTACIGKNGINTMLLMNPDYLEKQTPEGQIDLLVHELMHLCFNHIFIEKELNISKENHHLFNIAADLVNDQYLKHVPDNMWEQLDKKYPDLVSKLEKNKGAKYYYENLIQYCKDNNLTFPSISGCDSHDSWKEFKDLSSEEQQLVSNQIKHQLKEAATQTQKTRGTIPGELKDVIDELFKIVPPIFNWKAYFRRFLGFSNEAVVKKTMRKESKRFPKTAGLKIKFKQNILVGIDTSGSVSNEELCEFFSEIHHMYKSGVGITIQEFDTKIQRIYPYKGKWDGSISGRGGTDFGEFVDYYNAHKQLYTSAVIFTDGYAPVDRLKPHQKLMWVITSDGHRDNKYPGYMIQIPKSN